MDLLKLNSTIKNKIIRKTDIKFGVMYTPAQHVTEFVLNYQFSKDKIFLITNNCNLKSLGNLR